MRCGQERGEGGSHPDAEVRWCAVRWETSGSAQEMYSSPPPVPFCSLKNLAAEAINAGRTHNLLVFWTAGQKKPGDKGTARGASWGSKRPAPRLSASAPFRQRGSSSAPPAPASPWGAVVPGACTENSVCKGLSWGDGHWPSQQTPYVFKEPLLLDPFSMQLLF